MFIQPCFIRKNTKEIKDRLEKLGYYPFFSEDRENRDKFKIVGCNHKSWALPSYFNIKYLNLFINSPENYIDCGKNEELFFALASLKDSSDYMQWFTNGNDWILCDRDDFLDMYSVLCSGGKYKKETLDKFRKATPKELVKHFRNINLVQYLLFSFFLVLGLLELVVFCGAFYLLLLEDKLRILELSTLGIFIIILLLGFYKVIIEYGRTKGYFKKRRMD